eukprot:scaffold22461_cov73-Skeletonema_dohrnii-CCMP3373.AAC.2
MKEEKGDSSRQLKSGRDGSESLLLLNNTHTTKAQREFQNSYHAYGSTSILGLARTSSGNTVEISSVLACMLGNAQQPIQASFRA